MSQIGLFFGVLEDNLLFRLRLGRREVGKFDLGMRGLAVLKLVSNNPIPKNFIARMAGISLVAVRKRGGVLPRRVTESDFSKPNSAPRRANWGPKSQL